MFARLSLYRPPMPSRRAAEMLAGFVYWLVFLLVLEPGNLLRAHHAGRTLTLDHEALRITVAACLGAAATPLALWLSRRFFPPKASRRPMVLFALIALGALDRVIAHIRTPDAPAAAEFLRQVAVKTRGRQLLVKLDSVDWIESQGNYLALHAAETHLVRETMADFAGRLDPARFVRIHRGTVVALDRIAAVENFDNGDGLLRLHDQTELKVSRNYRKDLLARWK